MITSTPLGATEADDTVSSPICEAAILKEVSQTTLLITPTNTSYSKIRGTPPSEF